MLSALILLPAIGAVLLLFIDRVNDSTVRKFSLFWTCLVFLYSILLLFFFDPTSIQFQLVQEFPWLSFANSTIIFAIDGISLFMILLTTFLIPICILLS